MHVRFMLNVGNDILIAVTLVYTVKLPSLEQFSEMLKWNGGSGKDHVIDIRIFVRVAKYDTY